MSIRDEEKRYEGLSPFELKNKLIDMAGSDSERMMLNAGRGNPNWVATFPRQAFFLLGNFALEEAHRIMSRPGMAGSPKSEGMGNRFLEFCRFHAETVGAQFLEDAFQYAVNTLGLEGDAFIGEMVDGILGDHYPTPDRMLENCEKIVQAYIDNTMCDSRPPKGTMDLFAVEGGTAAMTYIFNTLKENFLINPGDKIALGTPIFTPYLEIPTLNDYELVVVDVTMDEHNNWQYPDSEIEKLKDPAIKAFFIVNPSNPPSTSVAQESLDRLTELVKTERKDLIILTDDVYGTFVNGFRSLAAEAPANTILVYSFSKYFGATGWRLGVIGINRKNVMDRMIAELPPEKRRGMHDRYSSISTDPDGIKLIDRLVADSRAVALNHTAGLSTPQQIQMALFAFQELLDADSQLYKKEAQNLVCARYKALYKALGVEAPERDCYAMYYTTIDIPELAEKRFGVDFARWLKTEHEPIDFVWNLAEEKGVVLMDGGGFAAPEMSIRVSLANLHEEDYIVIGKAVGELLADYYDKWKESAE